MVRIVSFLVALTLFAPQALAQGLDLTQLLTVKEFVNNFRNEMRALAESRESEEFPIYLRNAQLKLSVGYTMDASGDVKFYVFSLGADLSGQVVQEINLSVDLGEGSRVELERQDWSNLASVESENYGTAVEMLASRESVPLYSKGGTLVGHSRGLTTLENGALGGAFTTQTGNEVKFPVSAIKTSTDRAGSLTLEFGQKHYDPYGVAEQSKLIDFAFSQIDRLNQEIKRLTDLNKELIAQVKKLDESQSNDESN